VGPGHFEAKNAGGNCIREFIHRQPGRGAEPGNNLQSFETARLAGWPWMDDFPECNSSSCRRKRPSPSPTPKTALDFWGFFAGTWRLNEGAREFYRAHSFTRHSQNAHVSVYFCETHWPSFVARFNF